MMEENVGILVVRRPCLPIGLLHWLDRALVFSHIGNQQLLADRCACHHTLLHHLSLPILRMMHDVEVDLIS